MTELDRVIVTRSVLFPEEMDILGAITGLFTMQVCAVSDATDEEILEVCNRDNPSGTTNGWCTVIRKDTESHEGPGPCEDFEDRLHFLVTC